MDIKELNKTQLILLTLLITFVVSIATGIVTVSLMQQMPKTVPQTINNVIQRTIEKVTTVQAPASATPNTDTTTKNTLIDGGNVVVSIYPSEQAALPSEVVGPGAVLPSPVPEAPKALGEGIIISDVGLILVDSSILTDKDTYKVTLGKIDFNATVLKKFSNGFTILKLSPKKEEVKNPTPTEPSKTDTGTTPTPKLDNNQ